MSQHYYNLKPMEKTALPEATMKELRLSHFNLGGSRPNYSTETNSYQAFNANNVRSKDELPVYQCGTWVDNQAKFNGVTTNQR